MRLVAEYSAGILPPGVQRKPAQPVNAFIVVQTILDLDGAQYNINREVLEATLRELNVKSAQRLQEVLQYALKPDRRKEQTQPQAPHLLNNDRYCAYCGQRFGPQDKQRWESCDARIALSDYDTKIWVQRGSNFLFRVTKVEYMNQFYVVHAHHEASENSIEAIWDAPEFLNLFFLDRRASS